MTIFMEYHANGTPENVHWGGHFDLHAYYISKTISFHTT